MGANKRSLRILHELDRAPYMTDTLPVRVFLYSVVRSRSDGVDGASGSVNDSRMSFVVM